jgi:triosephosphate isomerase (TIM)
MDREIIVIGNWKMYKMAREAIDYIQRLSPQIEGSPIRVLLAAPYTSIASAVEAAEETAIVIGAQNMNDAKEGAFTGEVAALMLLEAGASFVILGHSERRRLFGETDEVIHRKVMRALQDDLQPVLCVGETLEEKSIGKTEHVLKHQIESALKHIPETDIDKVILAYEPIWAIGTGKNASAQQAQDIHIFCRRVPGDMFGKKKASQMAILYGGSVNVDNVRDYVTQKDIDGVLVGGASLAPDTMAAIIKNCEGVR